jgi:chemotaxis protein CheY-P-specific phosphatase CheC
MEFSKEVLQDAADQGSNSVAKAFTKLSGEKVSVTASAAELVSYKYITENLHSSHKNASFITYAQMISGTTGVSILVIPREETLALVDLLSNQEIGSTGVLKDLDRSAVKETLNILSNSYLTALSKISSMELIIGAPYMMTGKNLENLVGKVKDKAVDEEENTLVFKTSLEIDKHKITAQLYLIFNEKFVDLIKTK